MSSTYRHPYSNTPGNTPPSLGNGVIAVNQADGKLFYRNASGEVTQFPQMTDPYDLGTYPLITISSQPSSVTITVGQSTSVSVTAAATSPTATIAYQWQLSTNSGSTWNNVSGATSSSLTITTPSQGSYQYRCLMTANLSSVFTSVATVTVSPSFSPLAVLLTSGTSYTIPGGASTMKAWAVGGGSFSLGTPVGGAGGVAFRTWSVSGGQTVSYAIGAAGATGIVFSAGGNTTVTFSGTTITGNGATSGTPGSFSGGDGGASGGADADAGASVNRWGGAVGGNNGVGQNGKRRRATDVSGLFAAVAAAGGKTVEDDGATPAFGSGAYVDKFSFGLAAGRGGGGRLGMGGSPGTGAAGGGAVVLYFT